MLNCGGEEGMHETKKKGLEQVFWISGCYYPAKEQKMRIGRVRCKSREMEVFS